MNKIFKNALVALVALTGLTMTSCVNKYEYSGATDEGSKVFFSKDLASTVDVSFDDNKFQVAVSRTSTAGELTVPVTVTMGEESIFTPAANSVSFADGEATAYLTFNYDPANVEYGKYDDIKVEISDASFATTYGLSAYAFKAGKTEWKLMEKNNGKGTYREDLMTSFGAETQIINVKIYESVVTKGKYMVEAPYDPEGDFGKNKMWSSADEAKEEYSPVGDLSVNLVIDASDPKYVWFPEFDSGYSYGDYGAISFLSYVQYYMDNGYDLEFLKPRISQYFGKMEDDVITMPAGSVLYAFGREPWNTTNDNGLFAIALPGATIGDFSLEATYSGIFTNPTGEVFAVTEVKLGDDATNTKAVVMSAEVDPSAVADAIAGGDLEGIDVVDGSNNVPIPEDLSGKLQVIFVVMNGANVKTVVSVPFEYYRGDGNPWQSLGTGYLTDDFVVTMFYETYDEATETGTVYEPKTYEVEILENTDEPGAYRIVDAFKGVTSYLKSLTYESANLDVNATNPDAVYIETQSTGLFDGSDEIAIASYGGYSGNVNYMGKLVDGVITFPVLQTNSGTIFQGIVFFGTSGYYTGNNGAFKIVLPSASAGVKAKAKRAAAAADFEHRLNGGNVHRVKGVHVKKSSLQNRFSERPQTLKK